MLDIKTVEKLIFLDIDGVLNNHVCHPKLKFCSINKGCATIFNEILEETGAKFVLSSAWRYNVWGGGMTIEGLKNLFYSHWIDASRLIGITRKDISPYRSDRGQQITEWISENRFAGKYIVIDDMDLEITQCGHPFFQTNWETGLTCQDKRKIIQLLL